MTADGGRPAPDRPDAGVLVSVVVPVYNPGQYLEPCIRSIIDQSLPSTEFEAIFVDDGSTDESPARLDELAAQHPNVRVIHQPNSGWPGKPRNVGIDAARGKYIYFVDHDDVLGHEALERLHAFAERNGSDIVIGKMAGQGGRGAPRMVFLETRDRVTVADSHIVAALSPHKLFRKAFLDEHGIRFPEGRRRLEDQVFVLKAYFAADVISILADYTCYFHVAPDDRANAASGRYDPAGRFDAAYYFRFLREVLDVVEANTEPGPLRDRLLRRFVARELLGRLTGRRFISAGARRRRILLDEIRAVVERYIPASAEEALNPHLRTRMALVRADRLDLLVALARADRGVSLRAESRRIRRLADGRTSIAIQAEVVDDGRAVVFPRTATGLLLPVPARVAAAVPERARSIQDPPTGRFQLVLERVRDGAQSILSATVTHRQINLDGGARVVHAIEVVIDPNATVEEGTIGTDRWNLIARLYIVGYVLEGPIHRRVRWVRSSRLEIVGGSVVSRGAEWAIRPRLPERIAALAATRPGQAVRRAVGRRAHAR
jgi:glycosyltransferase involved in cell wall biosynthesis